MPHTFLARIIAAKLAIFLIQRAMIKQLIKQANHEGEK